MSLRERLWTVAFVAVCIVVTVYGLHIIHGADFEVGLRMISNDARVFGECPTNGHVHREMLFRQPFWMGEVWDAEMVKEVCRR